MTTIQTIGTQIAKLRKEKNITQDELAKNLDVSAQAVSKWENGGAPDIELLPKIADYFDVSIDVLFGRKNANTESGLTQQAYLERLDSVQREMSVNSMRVYNDTIKSLVALEFENDEAKDAAINNISGTFCYRDELQMKLMQSYQRLYEQGLQDKK
ncbi:MAG: helix-turn-helix transcriptional regulator [Clostridia bacterium]|nr:helix-turn-helix transcriptional regulator [Clostridia bacterium]